MSSVDRPLALAAQNYRVFPVRADRKPYFKGWPEEATTDAEQIQAWWRKYPAAQVAIEAGSGLAVVDLDVKHEKETGENGIREFTAWAKDHDVTWSPTVATPSGGQHVYFRTPDTFPNSVGEILKGVDVRSDRGYVMAYGDVPDLDALPDLPPAVAELLRSKGGQTGTGEPASARRVGPAGVKVALEREVFLVMSATEGTREKTLNKAAYSLGQLIGPHLDADTVRTRLFDAAMECGLPEDEARGTIADALRDGLANPRDTTSKRAPLAVLLRQAVEAAFDVFPASDDNRVFALPKAGGRAELVTSAFVLRATEGLGLDSGSLSAAALEASKVLMARGWGCAPLPVFTRPPLSGRHGWGPTRPARA